LTDRTYQDCLREAQGDTRKAAALWAKVKEGSAVTGIDAHQSEIGPTLGMRQDKRIAALERALKAVNAQFTVLRASLESVSNNTHIIHNTLVQLAGINSIPYPCLNCHNTLPLMYDPIAQRWRCPACGNMPLIN
jgi:hypothetical protein